MSSDQGRALWHGRFEAFSLTLMREMPVKRAADILGEGDTRLWRMLFAHVQEAHAALDFSTVVNLAVDEMNLRKGHEYLTVFADLAERRELFATEGKDGSTFGAFADELLRHNGHPHAIRRVAMDLSAAYRKGATEQLRNAKIVHDPFHVTALASEAVDKVRCLEGQEGNDATKASLKGSMYLFRKNPENLTLRQAEALDAGKRAFGRAGHRSPETIRSGPLSLVRQARRENGRRICRGSVQAFSWA